MERVHVVTYYLFTIVVGLSIILVLTHMLYRRRSPASIVAWLLSIIFLPYIAIPLYFILGTRKRPHIGKSPISMDEDTHYECDETSPVGKILKGNKIPAATCHNHFELFTNGVEAYEVIMKLARESKESIYIGTYIMEYDSVTKKLFKLLIEKASSGVDVRLLLDSVGSYKLYLSRRRVKKLIRHGVKVSFFSPVISIPPSSSINLRNHRKIYIFDRKTVLSGGMNLSKEYISPKPSSYLQEDLLFLLRGASVLHYLEVFASDWEYAAGETISVGAPKDLKEGNHVIQVVPSGPDLEGDALFEALMVAIYSANERIWIVTPYFAPDTSLMRALLIAKRRGVDVKLITPLESDHIIADLTRSSYMRELEENGVHVALYSSKMLHAKAILFDETSVMLGSPNFDNRSLFLNYEIASFAYSKETIKKVEAWMKDLLEKSKRNMPPATRCRRVAENFMRIFAPQI